MASPDCRLTKGRRTGDPSFGWRQRTLKAAIDCVGVGVHSGRRVNLTIRPAAADHGIVFRRTDLNRAIAARFDNVADTRLCTVLADPAMPSARVGTVEHLMAALAGLAIDNAADRGRWPGNPDPRRLRRAVRVPAGLRRIGGTGRAAPCDRDPPPVRVTAGKSWAELRPLGPVTRAAQPVLEMDLSIDFAASAIGRQSASLAADAGQLPPRDRRRPHLRPRRGSRAASGRRPGARRQPRQRDRRRWREHPQSRRPAHGRTSSPATSCWTPSATWRWPAAGCTDASSPTAPVTS